MSEKEVEWGPKGSLLNTYMMDRHSVIKRMQDDGWDTSKTIEEQRKWMDGQKRDKTKKMGVLLVNQLAGVIKQVKISTRKWSDDKNKIKQLKSRVRELEKQNNLLEPSWGPLPPYTAMCTKILTQEPTAPVIERVEGEINMAPVVRTGTEAAPRARHVPFTPGDRQQVLNIGEIKTSECEHQNL